MRLNFYVAAAAKQVERASSMIRSLESISLPDGTLPYKCTCDWTKPMREAIAAGKTDGHFTVEQRWRIALMDLRGVRDADILIFLVPPPSIVGRGSWAEAFTALRSGTTYTIVAAQSRDAIDSSIFLELPSKSFVDEHCDLQIIDWFRRAL